MATDPYKGNIGSTLDRYRDSLADSIRHPKRVYRKRFVAVQGDVDRFNIAAAEMFDKGYELWHTHVEARGHVPSLITAFFYRLEPVGEEQKN